MSGSIIFINPAKDLANLSLKSLTNLIFLLSFSIEWADFLDIFFSLYKLSIPLPEINC